MKSRSVLGIAFFAVIAAAAAFAIQATPASAKLCGVQVGHPTVTVPVVGQELTISYHVISPETGEFTDDPDCAIGADAEGEVEAGFRGFLDGTEMFSAELEKVDSWQYQTTVTFPEAGNWELYFDFSYVRLVTGLQRSQYRWKVDVAGPPIGLAAAGTGSGDLPGGPTFPLAYLLAAGGVAALAAGAGLRTDLKTK